MGGCEYHVFGFHNGYASGLRTVELWKRHRKTLQDRPRTDHAVAVSSAGKGKRAGKMSVVTKGIGKEGKLEDIVTAVAAVKLLKGNV